ncbi:MAG: hypothetical protein GX166_04880 [Clostridiaceae bacterium]|nr:hypothetical protein [Clostridiaceae bacterium]
MKRHHYGILIMIIAIFLAMCFTGCASQTKEDGKQMKNEEKEVYARIVPPEGFVEGTGETENVLVTYKKDMASIILLRTYVGSGETLDEYVRDSREKYEDDVLHFMEFEFVDTEGLEYSGSDKDAIAFEALQDKVLRKYWVVIVMHDEYAFEIVCNAPKDEFEEYAPGFNAAIASFEIFESK